MTILCFNSKQVKIPQQDAYCSAAQESRRLGAEKLLPLLSHILFPIILVYQGSVVIQYCAPKYHICQCCSSQCHLSLFKHISYLIRGEIRELWMHPSPLCSVDVLCVTLQVPNSTITSMYECKCAT